MKEGCGFGAMVFVLKLIAAAIAVALSTLTVLILAIPVFSLRTLVSIFAKVFRRDLDGVLKPMHAVFANDNLNTHPTFNITIVEYYDNDFDIETAAEKIQERLFPLGFNEDEMEYKRMKQSITSFCGYWFWKKIPAFNIRDHVRLYEDSILDEEPGPLLPIAESYGEEDFKQILDYLAIKPWRKNKGLWEIIILNKYRPSLLGSAENQKAAFIIRLHHCLGDGHSANGIVRVVGAYKGQVAAVGNSNRKKGNVLWRMAAPVLLPVKAFFDFTVDLAEYQWDSNAWINHPRNPAGVTFESAWSEAVPVERIKKLKRDFGVSFQAVILGISAGVFRQMMIETGTKIPAVITCFVPLPLPNHRGGLRIHLATACVKMHTGEADPVKRLVGAHQSIVKAGKTLGPLVLQKFMGYIGYFPRAIAELIIMPGVTVGLTPFIGMEGPIQFSSVHQCRESFFTIGIPPSANTAANMTTLSHFESIMFTFTSRDNLCQSKEILDKFNLIVLEELRALEEAAGKQILL